MAFELERIAAALSGNNETVLIDTTSGDDEGVVTKVMDSFFALLKNHEPFDFELVANKTYKLSVDGESAEFVAEKLYANDTKYAPFIPEQDCVFLNCGGAAFLSIMGITLFLINGREEDVEQTRPFPPMILSAIETSPSGFELEKIAEVLENGSFTNTSSNTDTNNVGNGVVVVDVVCDENLKYSLVDHTIADIYQLYNDGYYVVLRDANGSFNLDSAEQQNMIFQPSYIMETKCSFSSIVAVNSIFAVIFNLYVGNNGEDIIESRLTVLEQAMS